MAVTIEEMHVEVEEGSAAGTNTAATQAAPGEQKKEVNLQEALQLLNERKHRLKAD